MVWLAIPSLKAGYGQSNSALKPHTFFPFILREKNLRKKKRFLPVKPQIRHFGYILLLHCLRFKNNQQKTSHWQWSWVDQKGKIVDGGFSSWDHVNSQNAMSTVAAWSSLFFRERLTLRSECDVCCHARDHVSQAAWTCMMTALRRPAWIGSKLLGLPCPIFREMNTLAGLEQADVSGNETKCLFFF